MPDQPQQGAAGAEQDSSTRQLQLIVSWIVILILVAFGSFALWGLTRVHRTPGDFWLTLIREQFPVLVGLPMAGLGALFVTLVLRVASGPMEVELAGLKFEGAAAPIVFWLLCFMSIAIAIRLNWQVAG